MIINKNLIILLLLLFASGCASKPSTSLTPQAGNIPSPVQTSSRAASPSAQPALRPTAILLTGHTSSVTHLAWSPDSRILASACGDFDSTDFTARLWHTDGASVAVLAGHTQTVTTLAWSPDGRTLASGSLDGTIRLWHADGALIRTLEGLAGRVFALAWSPDGKTLASGSIVSFLNPTVQLWDSQDKILQTLSTSFSGGKFYNLAWSPDGRFLLGGATDYKLWRADGTQVFWLESSEHATPAWGMAWSPDSSHWAIGDESGNLSIYDVQGKRVAQVHDQSSINSLAWSSDGQKIASSKTLWRLDGSTINTLSSQPQYVNSLAWSPNGWLDGVAFASGGSDAIVHLWSAKGEHLAALNGHTASIRTVAWSPDGKILASASDDQTIRLWR